MRTRLRHLAAFAVGLLVVATVAPRSASAVDEQAARAFIDDLGRRTISVLETPDLSYDEARQRFRALFLEGFDTQALRAGAVLARRL